MSFRTIQLRIEAPVATIRLCREDARNAINAELVAEFGAALDACAAQCSVVVVEGTPEVFCVGADFQRMHDGMESGQGTVNPAATLYALWERLARGPFISVAHLRGLANAGGVGFVAACDLVVAERRARLSLSELLFGIYPACVLPFLVRRIGWQRANYMTLTAQSIEAEQAAAWGLIDLVGEDSSVLLQRQLARLRRLAPASIAHYKNYARALGPPLAELGETAVRSNHEMHGLPGVMDGIARYVETGQFPWERH